ncbi:MAG TPA: hypothetical protein VMF30_00525 [Pirellulales bacterium]|nr:hypothetical protein [Pirellulales bacterium]
MKSVVALVAVVSIVGRARADLPVIQRSLNDRKFHLPMVEFGLYRRLPRRTGCWPAVQHGTTLVLHEVAGALAIGCRQPGLAGGQQSWRGGKDDRASHGVPVVNA